MAEPWWRIGNVGDVPSPALLIYPDRASDNLERLIGLAGGTGRLTPHMKTHKLSEIAQMHAALGMTRVKCATIAEAEMLARSGASDVLLAYQPVGPAIARLISLILQFPGIRFSALVDDERVVREIDEAGQAAGRQVPLLVDLDVGMHRTGIAVQDAAGLYSSLSRRRGVAPDGLHAYDGHLRDRDLAARQAQADEVFERVASLRADLLAAGLPVPRVVMGGTPTLSCHRRRTLDGLELSPGTAVFWDAGYAAGLPDLPFQPAALVLTRVVSKPGASRVCLDLGHKAIASEMPHPRVVLIAPEAIPGAPAAGLDMPVLPAEFIGHSEEHLVLETPHASDLSVGDVLYGVPWHVCPTVALHGEAVAVRDGSAAERWKVVARERTLTI